MSVRRFSIQKMHEILQMLQIIQMRHWPFDGDLSEQAAEHSQISQHSSLSLCISRIFTTKVAKIKTVGVSGKFGGSGGSGGVPFWAFSAIGFCSGERWVCCCDGCCKSVLGYKAFERQRDSYLREKYNLYCRT